MKRLLVLVVALGILLSPSLVMGEEEVRGIKIGEETYLPETTDLNVLSTSMATAIRVNPVSLPDYIGVQVDFWAEVLVRFLKTAKPTVVFKDKACPGLEITVKEWDKVVLTWGKVYQIEGGEIVDQPSFWAIEARDFPVLADLAEIFTKLRPQIIYVDNKFWFGLSYELTEE